MKKLLTLVVVIAIALVIVFVFMNNSTSSQVKKLQKFTANVEQEYETYTEADLEKAVADYKKISEKIDESKLTDVEKKQVSKLRGECNTYFAKAKGRMMMDKLKDAGSTLKGVVDAFTGKGE